MRDETKLYDKMMDLDCLVFSSHKTATQTLTHTLRQNGYECMHCHTLSNISMKRGEFYAYALEYLRRHHKKLRVISVFRDPIDRHISSFFQWYGTKPLWEKEVESKSDTIIFRKNITELQNQLVDEIDNDRLVGRSESIVEICDELGVDARDLRFSFEKQHGVHESNLIELHLFRFDFLVEKVSKMLSLMTGHNIVQHDSNRSNSKWYREIYAEFKSSLRIPTRTIDNIYYSRRTLIELFYKEDFDSILSTAHNKYNSTS